MKEGHSRKVDPLEEIPAASRRTFPGVPHAVSLSITVPSCATPGYGRIILTYTYPVIPCGRKNLDETERKIRERRRPSESRRETGARENSPIITTFAESNSVSFLGDIG